jgi:hypothetical protein
MKSEPGPPMTLGNAAAAHVRLIVWCGNCRHQVEPATASLVPPKVAQVPIPPKWRDGTVPRRLCTGTRFLTGNRHS